jgi:HSP20 family protein
MSLLGIDNFANIDSVIKNINRFGNEISKGVTFETGGFNPRVNIIENEDGINVTVELAGVKKEDVNISVNDENILTIKGERKTKEEQQSKNFLRKEIVFGAFSRSFLLPDNLDSNKITAKFNDGVLNISVAKKEVQAPKEIHVQIN